MSNTKTEVGATHTPGPWHIVYNTDYYGDDCDDKDRYILKIEDAAGGTVLYTDAGYFRPHPGNAQLIAAAPELLAALKLAANELNIIRARDGAPQHISWDRGRPLQTDGCTKDWWRELTEQCFAVIAKAEGRTP